MSETHNQCDGCVRELEVDENGNHRDGPGVSGLFRCTADRYTTDELLELAAAAVEAFNALSPEEQYEHRRQQARSFAYGNLACSTNHRPTSRESFDRVMDELEEERRQTCLHKNLGHCQVGVLCMDCGTKFDEAP